jgi:uncharacterized protein with HEPN domain
MERDLQSLLDMLQSAKIVMGYIAGRSRSELDIDLQFQDSVVHRLLIIGEASKRVSEDMRQSIPIIPWTAISGMRNRLIHEYDEINLNIVWETIVNNLPNLILELEKIVPPDE